MNLLNRIQDNTETADQKCGGAQENRSVSFFEPDA